MNSELNLLADIWSEVRRHFSTKSDVAAAANDVVMILVDNGYKPESISESFAGDAAIELALAEYLDDDSDCIDSEDDDWDWTMDGDDLDEFDDE